MKHTLLTGFIINWDLFIFELRVRVIQQLMSYDKLRTGALKSINYE